MDKNYWKNYYKKNIVPNKASLFAQFVLENYLKNQETLIELGCGNGRDSIFFADKKINVTAIDQCENEILILYKNNSHLHLRFICTDFTKLGEIGFFDNIYSRFTLHSISDKDETNVINWSYEHLNKNGKLLIETRGQKNEIYKLGEPVPNEQNAYIYENHYRRFTDFNILCKKITDTGFKIIFAKEEKGFAPFGDTNYTFIRIVAEK